MTHLLQIIHRPFCEQFHAGTFFHITEEACTDSQDCPRFCYMRRALMFEEKEEASKQSALNTKEKEKNCLSPKEERKTVMTPG